MKKLALIAGSVLLIASLTGCNYTTKVWGGTMEIKLPPNTKLVNATWKDAQLWYLTRPAQEGEIEEVWTFQEKSNTGLLEGTVIFKEDID